MQDLYYWPIRRLAMLSNLGQPRSRENVCRYGIARKCDTRLCSIADEALVTLQNYRENIDTHLAVRDFARFVGRMPYCLVNKPLLFGGICQ